MKVPLIWDDFSPEERDAFVKAMFAATDLSDPAAMERFISKLEQLRAEGHPCARSLAKKIDQGEIDVEEV